MCGIFGGITRDESHLAKTDWKKTIHSLFTLSESRGKEAAGIAALDSSHLHLLKEPLPASQLLKTKTYQSLWRKLGSSQEPSLKSNAFAWMGHSRLVTDGHELNPSNNQPIHRDQIVCVHNGIIVNHDALWKAEKQLQRQSEVDTEIFPALLRKYFSEEKNILTALKKCFKLLKGTISTACLFEDLDIALLATNNGSLYYAHEVNEGNIFIFASEKFMLEKLISRGMRLSSNSNFQIKQLKPKTGLIISLSKGAKTELISFEEQMLKESNLSLDYYSRKLVEIPSSFQPSALNSQIQKSVHIHANASKLIEIDPSPIRAMKRCTKCVLPESFPFTSFDEKGVCNYCQKYLGSQPKGEAALKQLAQSSRDCIVPFSGGRDSSYALHYLKTKLDLNPIAYTYDWGMVTDIARRNISRLCGQLGIEHILISADIRKKRAHIKQNVEAWLKRPRLGTIPLFMAGDKQFFYFAHQLRKRMGVDLTIFSMNPLERTDFKVGFCGIREEKKESRHYSLSFANKLKMCLYYGKEFLLNPSYINSSLWDTLFGFFSYYIQPHQYKTFYDYIPWDEKVINDTLIREYEWEVDTTTQTTWRIGDGTAAFYNYIYYRVSGFSENDTLRSNQIREGHMTRKEALEKIELENQPRYEAIQWYCKTIGLDFEATIKKINQMKPLYQNSK